MPHTFSVTFTQKPGVLIEKARRLAQENDLDFQGDEFQGTFSGSGVEGIYTVGQGEVIIEITSKPFYAPWQFVENRVREFFV